VDTNELVSDAWFEKSDVAAAARVREAIMKKDVAEKAIAEDLFLNVLIPPTGVLTQSLIDNWLEDV
jgi:hypothetical protein